MSHKKHLLRAFAALPFLGALAAFAVELSAAEPPAAQGGAEAHFVEIAKVLQSPRCRNCHPAGDAPLHGDASTPHSMNVSRKSPDAGLRCTTCHRSENQEEEHAPPGVSNWHMPSATTPMVFEGLSVAELCKRLTDTKQNGGRTPEMLKEHMEHDALVLWAWKPGKGRSTPPLTHEALISHTDQWVKAGAPCPK